jgi:hypothetical protein
MGIQTTPFPAKFIYDLKNSGLLLPDICDILFPTCGFDIKRLSLQGKQEECVDIHQIVQYLEKKLLKLLSSYSIFVKRVNG